MRATYFSNMTNESSINGNDNIVIQGSTFNIIQISGQSHQYQSLIKALTDKQEIFALLPKDHTERRSQIYAEIEEIKQTIEKFKYDVLALANSFNKIEINTDRLKLAQEFFYKGQIDTARNILETELDVLRKEQTTLIEQRDNYETDILPKLKHNSEEFFLLAFAAQLNYDNPNRFEQVCRHFEDSINSFSNEENTRAYMSFLQEQGRYDKVEEYLNLLFENFDRNSSDIDRGFDKMSSAQLKLLQNKFEESYSLYKEALDLFRKYEDTGSTTILYGISSAFKGLAQVRMEQDSLPQSLVLYSKASNISIKLALTGEAVYVESYADVRLGVAALYVKLERYPDAVKEYKSTLDIFHQLTQMHRQRHLISFAGTLNNLALLHQKIRSYAKAREEFEEAIELLREGASFDANVYLRVLALALHNSAGLKLDIQRFDDAIIEYKEAFSIREELAIQLPDYYELDFAITSIMLAHTNLLISNYEDARHYAATGCRVLTKIAENRPELMSTFEWALDLLSEADKKINNEN